MLAASKTGEGAMPFEFLSKPQRNARRRRIRKAAVAMGETRDPARNAVIALTLLERLFARGKAWGHKNDGRHHCIAGGLRVIAEGRGGRVHGSEYISQIIDSDSIGAFNTACTDYSHVRSVVVRARKLAATS
jgi:hypothetical protein